MAMLNNQRVIDMYIYIVDKIDGCMDININTIYMGILDARISTSRLLQDGLLEKMRRTLDPFTSPILF
jgi:hypothetical protein